MKETLHTALFYQNTVFARIAFILQAMPAKGACLYGTARA